MRKKRTLAALPLGMILACLACMLGACSWLDIGGLVSDDQTLTVTLLDVGQGDSIVVRQGEHALLIDAGEASSAPGILQSLEDMGITRLDMVIATHPHADHIGGLPAIMDALPIDCFIMPEVVQTTKTFERLLDALEANDIALTAPVVGQRFSLGEATITVLSPAREYDELNDNSVAIRLSFGYTAFLLCGDAQSAAEKDMLNSGLPLSADVLKLSHHGSATSNTQAFLDAVSPRMCAISVGQDNNYGLPHREVLARVQAMGCPLYRTDTDGPICFISDGYEVISIPSA
nr:ComEC/Rec2 family competence protein [bacterium]